MAATEKAWGFSHSLTVNICINEFMARAAYHARDRGITDTLKPSDQLDMSRDVILADAAADLDAECAIVDGVLRVWPRGMRFNWDEVAAVAHNGQATTSG